MYSLADIKYQIPSIKFIVSSVKDSVCFSTVINLNFFNK